MSFPIDTATNFAHELRPPVPEDPAIFLPFFTDDAIVFEHCPKIMSTPPAKFIAKEFKGKGEIAEYFKLLGETLQAKEMVVDKWWNVEGDGFKTEVLGGRGEAVWEAVGSRKKFREEFVYKLELENQGRDWAIKRWDIYADPEKMGKAMVGELDEKDADELSTKGRELAEEEGMNVPPGGGGGIEH